jgi:hypothetical protein
MFEFLLNKDVFSCSIKADWALGGFCKDYPE